jgi:transposase-like protein
MPPCPDCQQPAAKRNGHDRRGRQKYACCQCRRTFTEDSASAFSGYRWSRDVILTAVRWYLAYPLSSRQVLELLAERGIDVSHRTVLNWAQAFGPQLAAEVRRRRRPVGACWTVDEVCFFRKGHKL